MYCCPECNTEYDPHKSPEEGLEKGQCPHCFFSPDLDNIDNLDNLNSLKNIDSIDSGLEVEIDPEIEPGTDPTQEIPADQELSSADPEISALEFSEDEERRFRVVERNPTVFKMNRYFLLLLFVFMLLLTIKRGFYDQEGFTLGITVQVILTYGLWKFYQNKTKTFRTWQKIKKTGRSFSLGDKY